MSKMDIIYDGDMGGDDLWAIATMLAYPDKFEIKGFATCYGNVSQPYATNNTLDFLKLMGRENDFEVAQGANAPCDGMRPFGDDAYGQDGVGGVALPKSSQIPHQGDIADWYAAKLDENPGATIVCTGPATNIALFIEKYPEKAPLIDRFIFMGGAICPPGKDGKPVIMENGEKRRGNITPWAEFNAYQDPKALNIILKSGIAAVDIVAADATQHMVFTKSRQNTIKDLDQTYGDAFHRMLMVVEELDQKKFGVESSFIHDPMVVVYLLKPKLFDASEIDTLYFDESAPHPFETSHRGETYLSGGFRRAANWVHNVRDTDAAFQVIADGIRDSIDYVSGGPKPPAI